MPLTPEHLLDEEIDTLRALIGEYDKKIAMLEEKQTSQATQVNTKGVRVPYGQVKLSKDAEETIDFYQFRMDTETNRQEQELVQQTRFWQEKIELIFAGEQVLCHQFISVKAINKASQGYHVSMLAAAALPGGRLQLTDIYGNFLLQFQTEDADEIIDIQTNPKGASSPDDMFVAALTEKGFLYVFSL